MSHTWDGLPVASDRPHGAMVVVRRPAGPGGPGPARPGGPGPAEYLMLHRAHRGPAYEGDWAWTPPSGARLPGEPVLAGARRELAEEAGLTGVGLIPVDLSGEWAVFAADVPAGTEARLDPEHDKLAWLPRPDAERRCRPDVVLANFRRSASLSRPAISFRPLTRSDLPDLVAWQHASHVARWFPELLDLATAERKYGPRIDGTDPAIVHVLLVGGRASGFLQSYHLRDYPDYQAACGGIDAIGIDYAIGVAGLTGRGLGPQMIWSYLRRVVFGRWPGVPLIAASPDVANQPSLRALAKAGFVPAGEIAGQHADRPELLCTLDRGHIFGPIGELASGSG
jgi:RimJ/RimL family protein N-acetyltransferase/8-oxo-dGTP pyrophosphatase MutT (NUDIX family)